MERWWRIWLPALIINWDCFPLFPFKNCHGWTQSSEPGPAYKSTFSPDCWLFWIKHLSSLWNLLLHLLAVEGQAVKPMFSYRAWCMRYLESRIDRSWWLVGCGRGTCGMSRAWSHARGLGSLGSLGELSKGQGFVSLTGVGDIAARWRTHFECVDSEDPWGTQGPCLEVICVMLKLCLWRWGQDRKEIGEPSVCRQQWRHGRGYYPGMLCCEEKLEAEPFSFHGIGWGSGDGGFGAA